MKFCSFSVSGGAYCYQMGIAKHIQTHFDLSDVLFSGASGGTWPALLLAAGVDIQYAFDIMMLKSVPQYENKAFGAYGCYDLGNPPCHGPCRLAFTVVFVAFRQE